jgi:GNAT superfamily N-acetyltransferase
MLAVTFEPASADDAEALVAIRIAAMRESLDRIGRFDPQRARDRFLAHFDPACTRHVLVDGARAGFVVLRPQDDTWLLDHLYVLPSFQGRGIGAAVLRDVFASADAHGRALRVGALRESGANRFYARHGFELVGRTEWDNHYLRPAGAAPLVLGASGAHGTITS